ncbi:MAG: hypothetical protein WKF32_02860 [Thermoleophilaceae bacterium]
MARDGEADLVACPARGVRVQADGLDLADDCGTVRRSARAAAVLDVSNFEEPRVFSLDSGESSVTLSIACQEDALVRERGNLAVTSVLELPKVGLTRRDLASLKPEEE